MPLGVSCPDLEEKHCSVVGGFVLDYLATFDLQPTGMESSRLCSHSLLRVKETQDSYFGLYSDGGVVGSCVSGAGQYDAGSLISSIRVGELRRR